MVRLWSTGWGLCAWWIAIAWSIITPFAMSWLGSHLCSPWFTCSMRSDGAKESYDLLCWWAWVVVKDSPCVSWVLTRTAPSTFGPHIPLPYIVGQSSVKDKKNGTIANIRILQIPSLMSQLANSFFRKQNIEEHQGLHIHEKVRHRQNIENESRPCECYA